MIKKKDIDIKSIIRESYLESKKNIGLLDEQDFSSKQPESFEEDFDIEKHLSYLKILPKQFGKQGTFEAADVDEVINALVGGEQPGLQRFKKCLIEINRALGKKPGEFGFPSAQQSGGASAQTVFSALQLNYLISAIINKQDARVAGKMFEGLVARMVGANASNEDDSIEDMKIGSNILISLKTIDPTKTEFKGSKYNLAKAIATEGSVTYLVCEKDKRNDPFSFKAYSFTINQDNYFNFISGKGANAIISNEEFETLKAGIVQVQASENKNNLNEGKTQDQDLFDYAIKKYAIEQLGMPEEISSDEISDESRKNLIKTVRDHLKQIFDITFNSEDYKNLSNDKKINDEFLKDIENIKNSIPESLGKKILNRNTFEDVLNKVRNLRNVTLSDRQIEYYFNDYAVKNKLSNPEQGFNQFLQVLQPLLNVLEKIEKIYKEEATTQKKVAIEKGKEYAKVYSSSKTDIRIKIQNFFQDILRPDVYKQKTGGDTTQFKLSAEGVKRLAISLGANYDEDYESFIVSSGFIMTNASKNTDALRDWIKPIYKEFYSVDKNLKKFFIKNQPAGLSEAEKATESLKTEIQKVPKIQNDKGEPQYQSASQLKENTQKDLTKHWSEVMLEELLK